MFSENLEKTSSMVGKVRSDSEGFWMGSEGSEMGSKMGSEGGRRVLEGFEVGAEEGGKIDVGGVIKNVRFLI